MPYFTSCILIIKRIKMTKRKRRKKNRKEETKGREYRNICINKSEILYYKNDPVTFISYCICFENLLRYNPLLKKFASLESI